ncbi:hypothetical protein QYE76_056801 [Lolium multiflorum]|uniref:CCHC-type domain-containing protein n=1 Tax=Lolium multiflorum TaxID=4521 RepID=A0AAD8T2T6_LOLMU|nr:hypothetical protein QYE76_056801 [Lolium multiflorum]
MMQMLQMMMEDREATRAERQANLAALQQIAQNNQGHGNHDHPGSKLKNFQNTNPPMFSKTEEPLDADDWLQTMENNLEVAGVEAAEKVLFATHYLSGPARAWWTSARAMNAGQMMNWEDFKLKFSKYHVPQGLIKKMRDEFRELKQGRMSVVEYRDKFLTLSRYAPDETDTNEKRKERFLNGLHDEMQTVLVNIPFADLEALVDSAIQMEGKLHQANENRKRRMMNQNGPTIPEVRNNSSGGFTPRHNKPPAQNYRPNYSNNNGGPPKPGGNPNNTNNHPNGNNNNPNNAPKTGSNTVPINPKDKSTINCYECGVVGHYSNECPKKLARIAANTAAPAQQQRRFAGRKNQNNNNGRLYHMNAAEAQEAPQAIPKNIAMTVIDNFKKAYTAAYYSERYDIYNFQVMPAQIVSDNINENDSGPQAMKVILQHCGGFQHKIRENDVIKLREQLVFYMLTFQEILVRKYSRNGRNFRPVLFLRSFRKTEEISGATRQQARARGPSPAAPTSPRPRVAPALTFRLLKASVAKPQYREPRYGKPSETPPRIPSRGIQEIASGTPAGEGFISRRTLHRHGRLRSDE